MCIEPGLRISPVLSPCCCALVWSRLEGVAKDEAEGAITSSLASRDKHI